MRHERANVLLILGIVLIGQFSACLGDESHLFIILPIAVCVSWWLNYARGGRVMLSRRAADLLGLGICAYFAVTTIRAGGAGIIVNVTHFVAVTQLILLLGALTVRTTKWICMITFCLLAVATVRTVQVTYAVLLVLWAVATGLCLTLNDIRARLDKLERDAAAAVIRVGGLVRRSLALCSGAGVIGLVVFFSMPRLGTNILGPNVRMAGRPVSGFDANVDLGDIGRIRLSSRKVFDVTLTQDGRKTDGGGIPLYWRGIALDSYDGRHWKCTTPRRIIWQERLKGCLRGWRIPDLPGPAALKQEIMLQPISARSLFLLFPVHWVSVPKYRILFVDGDAGRVEVVRPRGEALRYQVLSEPLVGRDARVGHAVTAATKKRCLILPSVISARTKELARRLTARVKTPYRKARAIEAYLSNVRNFTYTLDVPETGSGEPIDTFLFENKAGHCEYFASAMVILLRAAGIPARMVNGFKGGDWNEFGRFYTVREWHAHSWVEGLMPGKGWVTFDPTPEVAMHRPFGTRLTGLITRFLEFLDMKWVNLFIAYSREDQREFLARFGRRGGAGEKVTWVGAWNGFLRRIGSVFGAGTAAKDDKTSDTDGARAPSASALFFVLTLFAAGVIFLLVRRKLKSGRSSRPDPVGRLYGRFVKIMARRGLHRELSQTPLEFAAAASQMYPIDAEHIWDVTFSFCEARYGRKPLSHDAVERLRRCLGRLAKKSRSDKQTLP